MPHYRSITARAIGSQEATGRVLQHLDTVPGLTTHQIGPGRISVARTYRPAWAVVTCLLTFWLAGLGFLFLLVRRTEAAEIVLSDSARGCVVVVPPMLDDTTFRALDQTLTGTAPAATPEWNSLPDDGLDETTVDRPALQAAATEPTPAGAR